MRGNEKPGRFWWMVTVCLLLIKSEIVYGDENVVTEQTSPLQENSTLEKQKEQLWQLWRGETIDFSNASSNYGRDLVDGLSNLTSIWIEPKAAQISSKNETKQFIDLLPLPEITVNTETQNDTQAGQMNNVAQQGTYDDEEEEGAETNNKGLINATFVMPQNNVYGQNLVQASNVASLPEEVNLYIPISQLPCTMNSPWNVTSFLPVARSPQSGSSDLLAQNLVAQAISANLSTSCTAQTKATTNLNESYLAQQDTYVVQIQVSPQYEIPVQAITASTPTQTAVMGGQNVLSPLQEILSNETSANGFFPFPITPDTVPIPSSQSFPFPFLGVNATRIPSVPTQYPMSPIPAPTTLPTSPSFVTDTTTAQLSNVSIDAFSNLSTTLPQMSTPINTQQRQDNGIPSQQQQFQQQQQGNSLQQQQQQGNEQVVAPTPPPRYSTSSCAGRSDNPGPGTRCGCSNVVPEGFCACGEVQFRKQCDAPEVMMSNSEVPNGYCDVSCGRCECCPSVYQQAKNLNLTMFVDILDIVSLAGGASVTESLKNPSHTTTVFVPTDEAFRVLYEEDLSLTKAEFLASAPPLFEIAQQHVVQTLYAASAEELLAGELTFSLPTTLPSSFITIEDVDGTVQGMKIETVGSSAHIIQPDVNGCNSIIHIIDQVLLSYVPEDKYG